MNKIIEKLEKEQMKTTVPELRIGSTMKVTFKIEEEGKERLQIFTGILVAVKRSGLRKTITLRRLSGSINIERVFQIHSPLISSIETIRSGKVRKAKLYYLRDKMGKEARIQEMN